MTRSDVLLWAQKYCNNPDLLDENDFAIVIDRLMDLLPQAGVAGESMHDMSQSFSKETAFTLKMLLSPYKRVRIL